MCFISMYHARCSLVDDHPRHTPYHAHTQNTLSVVKVRSVLVVVKMVSAVCRLQYSVMVRFI